MKTFKDLRVHGFRDARVQGEEGAGARFLKTTPKSTRDSITDIISQVYGVDIR